MTKQTDIPDDPDKNSTTDIVISGAGAAGLTLALLLAKAGLRVCIIDPTPEKALLNDAISGRTVALMDTSINIVKTTGVFQHLNNRYNPLNTMKIIDISRAGKHVEESFDADEIGLEQFGYNIPNNYLRSSLYKTAKQTPNIRFHLERKFARYAIDTAHTLVTLDDGTAITARLLVGADGRNSAVREAAGIAAQLTPYNQSAITCVINHSKSHNNTSTEFHRPDGPLAFVPLPGNQSSVVWVNTPERSDALLKLKKQEFIQALQDEMQTILGGITLETAPECWPLSTLKAETLIATRVALAAEAAHVMSPITAQGLNLSLRDVAALAETIVDAARVGQDIGSTSVLRQYEKRRQLDINTRVFGVDRMNKVVSNDIEAIKTLRHTGLKAVSSFPPLKRLAMRIGLAPAIDAGRLAKGYAL